MDAVPSRSERRDLWVPALALAALLPFLNKAFSVDDTLFLKLAQHLLTDPFDFYGFDVNWYGTSQPMHTVTKNPPLAGYVLAAAGGLFGWSEWVLHTVFLVPALASAWATTRLARRFTTRPVLAGLLAVATPVFLVSSTSVMCDMWMLAFWLGALLFWLRGAESPRSGDLWIGAGLAALAGVTKYFAIALLPLFAVIAILWRVPARRWLPPLVLPLGLWTGYELYTQALYDHDGHGLLLDAVFFATSYRSAVTAPPLWVRSLTGLVFAGGCLFPALAFAPVAWRARWLAIPVAVLAGLAVWAKTTPGFQLVEFNLEQISFEPWLFELQYALLLLAGAAVAGFALGDLARRRDRESLLLACWLGGTFVFATYVNWVNNGRSNLPMAPCIGILIARRLEALPDLRPLAVRVAGGLSAVVALLVAHGDAVWANTARRAAHTIAERGMSLGTTYFQGHWGFQWYMERAGAKALDLDRDQLAPGDHIVIPASNTHIFPPPDRVNEHIDLVLNLDARHASPVIVMSKLSGVGFYASEFGPLPFFAAPLYPEKYLVGRADAWIDYQGVLGTHQNILEGLPTELEDPGTNSPPR